jgi:hypothetical protein
LIGYAKGPLSVSSRGAALCLLPSDCGVMITIAEFQRIAEARIEDAEILCRSGRYDGAIYLCGYAVEIALKARICKTLTWKGYPSTKKEFENYQTFKTHNLDVLLSLSAVESEIKTNLLAEWSAVATWDPKVRYEPIGSANKQDVEFMIESAKALLGVIL